MKHFIISIAILLLFSTFSCTRIEKFPAGKSIICDAEQLNEKGDKFVAANDSSVFLTGGKQQTDIDAYSGKYSVLTFPKKGSFAFAHKIKDAGPDWYFVISVWRKSKDKKGVLVAASKGGKILYKAVGKPVTSKENGWEKLEMEVYTPPNFGINELSFYVWNNGSDSVFFDDLKIERLDKKVYPYYDEPPLAIILDTTDYLKIISKRKQAFEIGVLQSAEDDWVRGIVFEKDKMMKAKLRLKGDWLDHLRGTKWSYRIKMRKNNSWNRLRTFSIQTPQSRDFLREWEAHQFFFNADLLTTRYGFIPLIVNNQSRGLYAWEEHFEKYLLESQYRREGPILKFSEDAFWQMQRINLKFDDKWRSLPYFEVSAIKPFTESKTLSNPVLYQQFLNGQKLMIQYKQGIGSPSDIFDIKKMASYFAMLDLMKINHGKAWHNQRFYFNPVLCKLEPIAFDGYSDHPVFDSVMKSFTAYNALHLETAVRPDDYLYYRLFTDSSFVNYYLETLWEISDPEYIQKIKQNLNSDLIKYDSLIRMEYPTYNYDKEFLFNSANEIREYYGELEDFISEKLKDGAPEIEIYHETYQDTTIFEGTPEVLVSAYLQRDFSDSTLIRVYNFNAQKIVLLGTGRKDKNINYFLHPEPELDAFRGDNEVVTEFNSDTNAQFLFFMLKDRFETYQIPIFQWPFPQGKTPQQQLMELANVNNNPLIRNVSRKDIFIKTGFTKSNRPLIIPQGYKVHFSAGTTIDFVEGAMFISYSPVFLHGTKNNPVTITSSDFSANGFTVLQADETSIIDNALFENLNTLDYNGWTLTGAVTFYESDVTISNTTFYRNQCEDALNTIRSYFTVENSSFKNIFGDAFDSDFCTGEVKGTSFRMIGNDAIDFSGSRITIKNVLIEDAIDKGISGGEESFLKVENTVIKRSGIGIASKDLSVVEYVNGEVIDCNYGLLLLQKKPEYGPSVMNLDNTQIINSKTKMLIEEGSKVVIDGDTIVGTEKKLGELFY